MPPPRRLTANAAERLEVYWIFCQRWGPRLLALLAAVGLSTALGVGAAVLVHPPLFPELRPWWPLLAAVGLLSTAAGYWFLWGRSR